MDEQAVIFGEIQLAQQFRAEVIRLERIVAHDLCGMTSRPPSWRMVRDVMWVHDGPPLPASTKFSCPGVARECRAWSEWLLQVLLIHRVEGGRRVPVPLAEIRGVHPPPPPRDYVNVEVWPVADPAARQRRAGGHHAGRSKHRRHRPRGCEKHRHPK